VPTTATAADSKGTATGTYFNGPTLGKVGPLSGDSNTAVSFDGVDDYVSVARQVQDDLSVEFWFKSTQGLGTNAQWWGNAGLVDAEVAGAANDFGLSLRSDGRITAGTGTPDASIVSSSAGYDDGNWHHVVFTRTRSSGALNLYVDGVSAGSATGATASLTAPATINFGRIRTGGNYFAGTLDEVATYNVALSQATVTAHYQAR
jgi:concanavalin A-like lectin/glucanase superfamily protein